LTALHCLVSELQEVRVTIQALVACASRVTDAPTV
jgi:hypothetical protein